MSWRTVVVTGVAKLDYKMNYLVVRKQEGVSRVHLSEIEMLIVESTTVSLTTALLSELINNKVKVIFCDEKHNPSSELVSYYGSYDTSEKIRLQIQWNEHTKKSIWTEIIREKIENQRKHLMIRQKPESELLHSYIQELAFGDETNREGHAAKVYFNALFGKSFSREDDNSINAALDYGYTVLLAHFTRTIAAAGYITQLGVFHDNMFNKFNLASDLMEPFRPIVDYKVYDMNPEKFDKEEKREVLSLFSKEVIINGQRQVLNNAIAIYCRSVFEALNNDDICQLAFFEYEL